METRPMHPKVVCAFAVAMTKADAHDFLDAARDGVEVSMADLKAQSTEDPKTGCWVWNGPIDFGVPAVNLFFAGRWTKRRGRRAVVMLTTGQPIPEGFQVRRNRELCRNSQCVAPHHAVLIQEHAPPPAKPPKFPKPLHPENTVEKWRSMSSVFGFAEAMR